MRPLAWLDARFNRLSIGEKLMWLALLPSVLVALVLTLYSLFSGLKTLDGQIRERGRTISMALAQGAEYGLLSGNREALQALVQSTMRQTDVRAVAVMDGRGKVVAISGIPRQEKEAWLGGEEADTGNHWLGFSSEVLPPRLEVDDLLLDTGGPAQPRSIGHIYLELDTRALDEAKQELARNGLLVLVIGLVFAWVLVQRVAQGVLRPILRLSQTVRAMGEGNLGIRVEEGSADEFGDLERGFNRMADRLEDAHRGMQERIERATSQLTYQAQHDALTGLINRREFESRLAMAVTRARQTGREAALLYLDLDQFKVVNDCCGHAAGDDLLRQLTRLFRLRVREGDTLARLGGDEFALLLESCPVTDALPVAETLLGLVQGFRFVWNEQIFVVGVSIGLVVIDGATTGLDEVMVAADQACYGAKAAGRNCIHVHRRDSDEAMRRQGEVDWAARLTRALAEQQFQLDIQRFNPLLPGRQDTLFAEVFLRLADRDGRRIPPMAFLPAAERFDLLPQIERWVLDSVCRELAWLGQNSGCRLVCSVNLSAGAVTRSEFLDELERMLQAHGLAPNRLCLGIPESVASRNAADTQIFAERTRKLGCRLAIEDFGTGMGALGSLETLRPDFIKFPARVVSRLGDDDNLATLVRALCEVARNFQVATVAEGVETSRNLFAARNLGMDYVQGFVVEAPRPMGDWLGGLVRLCHGPRVGEAVDISGLQRGRIPIALSPAASPTSAGGLPRL